MKRFFGSILFATCLGGAVVGQVKPPFVRSQPVVIDFRQQGQRIDNIGASGCWFSESIGKYWPKEKKEQIAEWLFSREIDASGNPKGIGMSVFRFNIGGGTAEQGDSSGIRMVPRRVECFQRPDGTYDWSKQEGYLWFVRQAKRYGVEQLIAFSNTPPVQMTSNGYGYKTVKDFASNLAPSRYEDYAQFCADVIKHFDSEGLHFDYISPVNEPQWAWMDKPGEASQEGTAWKNDEIGHVVGALDSALADQKLDSKILITEAGQLNYLYGGSGLAGSQIQTFFPGRSTAAHLPRLIGGHSYFTESNDSTLVAVRKKLADTAHKYAVDFWETEYSMLADGFRDGAKGSRSAIDCALFLAKVIYADLTVANASAWQFWNSYEPGSADSNTRYYLIALKPDKDFKDGGFAATKNLWVLGNYSRWIRPGMHRVLIDQDALNAVRRVMVSAFTDGHRTVIVAVNYTNEPQELDLRFLHGPKVKRISSYVTSAADNLKYYPVAVKGAKSLLPRSVTTLVVN